MLKAGFKKYLPTWQQFLSDSIMMKQSVKLYWNLHPQKTWKMRKCFWRWTF